MKELFEDAVVISNSPFLLSSLTHWEKKVEGDNSPIASQVNFMHPDVTIEVIAIKILVKDRAKLSDQGDAVPAGVTTQSSCGDTDYYHRIGEEVRYPRSLVFLPHPWFGYFARQHRGDQTLALKMTRARALTPGRIHDRHWAGAGRRKRLSWDY
jgi:hypothetical protein